MNKIFRIVWNEAAQAWVAVSELTKKHKKRASVTAVAATLVAGMLSPFAQASNTDSEPGSANFNPSDPPSFDDKLEVEDKYKFGLVVVGDDGAVKTKFGSTDEEAGKVTISVEPTESSEASPTYKSSYLYLREDGGITIDQEGRSAKFKVKHGDGLTIGKDNKLVPDTIDLKVTNGKVTAPDEGNKKKLVNAGDLSSALNDLGWKVSANGGAASTVKSGDEVEFKGDGVTVTNTTDETGKHIVTIKAEQPQGGGAAGGSTPVTAGDGISVSADNKVSVNAKDKGGLTVGTDGVSVNADGTTIKLDDAGKVAAVTGAIENNAGNAQAKAGDGDKLTTVANVADAINAAKTAVTNADDTTVVKLADDGKTYKVAAKVADNKGLEKTADGLTVKAGTGVTVDASGVSVNTDGKTIEVGADGKVSAKTGTITAGNEASVADDDKGKLAKAGDVVAAINAAKTKVVAGNGIKVTPSGNTYTVSADLPFTKDAKDKSITLNEEGAIRNVANGRVAKDSKDAVNGGQLHAVESRLSGNMDKLNHRIDKVGKRADAGTASAIATANLLQSYRPGLSAATAAVGQYRGQSAVAVGYSRLSDNGKYGVKFSLGANTQGNVGAGAGVAYFW